MRSFLSGKITCLFIILLVLTFNQEDGKVNIVHAKTTVSEKDNTGPAYCALPDELAVEDDYEEYETDKISAPPVFSTISHQLLLPASHVTARSFCVGVSRFIFIHCLRI